MDRPGGRHRNTRRSAWRKTSRSTRSRPIRRSSARSRRRKPRPGAPTSKQPGSAGDDRRRDGRAGEGKRRRARRPAAPAAPAAPAPPAPLAPPRPQGAPEPFRRKPPCAAGAARIPPSRPAPPGRGARGPIWASAQPATSGRASSHILAPGCSARPTPSDTTMTFCSSSSCGWAGIPKSSAVRNNCPSSRPSEISPVGKPRIGSPIARSACANAPRERSPDTKPIAKCASATRA